MNFSRTAVGVFVGLCLVGGAGGAYLSTLGNEPTSAPTGVTVSVTSPAPVASVAEQPAAGVPNGSSQAMRRAPAPAAERRAPRPVAPEVREAPVATANPAPSPELDKQPLPAPAVEARNVPPAVLDAERPTEPEPARASEKPLPEFEELTVSADSVVGLRVESLVTSENARVEDPIVARVTRDVRVGDRVAIPAGSMAHGEVALVERGGRLRDRARLGIRFTSVVLADGTRIPLETETIYREGDAPGRESAAKIGGGAVGGAIIGGIFGGKKGAIIGGTAGAGTGTAAVMVGGRNPATLPAGTPITVRVITPTTVTVER